MIELTTIADDLTGACDVGAELATAGHRVRVSVDAERAVTPFGGGIPILNTQSRALTPALAGGRVRAALGAGRAPLVLKKIDTALRGHLGAEIDGAIDALGAPVFVLAAIPAAGRVTREGCQWFGDRLLADTEFAADPEGPGAESSIPAVVARESRRACRVLGRDAVAAGRLTEIVTRARTDGVEVFVVDAESDDDVRAAVAAILALPRPLCLAGSIALAAALSPHLEPGALAERVGQTTAVPLPALIVSGSLHSRAREQVEAVLAAGLAVAVSLRAVATEVGADVARRLAEGTSVVLAPAPAGATPTVEALRATEHVLAEAVAAVAARGPIPTLIVVGGETSYAILTRLGTGALDVDGRVAPLIARGSIVDGLAAGSVIVTKGGSGGDADAIARLLLAAGRRARKEEVA